MNINVALQCCINDYLLWLVTFQKSCMFQNIRSTNIARYDWLRSQDTFHEWMLSPSVGVIITSSGVLLIWKPRSCSPWQIINFENAKHRTTRHKKKLNVMCITQSSGSFRCHIGLERELWPRRSFSGKPLCVTGEGASWGSARDSSGGGGRSTWWEKGWRGALLGAPVGDGNPCSSGRWLPLTWWKPSGQSFTCALRCSQEKGADFLEIQDCHQLLRNLPFSIGKFLEVF